MKSKLHPLFLPRKTSANTVYVSGKLRSELEKKVFDMSVLINRPVNLSKFIQYVLLNYAEQAIKEIIKNEKKD